MGLFDGIEQTEVVQRSEYLGPGTFKLQIQMVKEGESRRGDHYFLSEFKILESTNPELPVGSPVTWMTMKRHHSFLKSVKAFIASAAGCAIDDVTAESCSQAVGAEQPLAGAIVHAQAKDVPTQSGGTFTKVTFRAAE